MSAQEDPPRLFSPESGANEDLRLALGTAREDLPSTARLEAILASLPLAIPSGGGSGGMEGGGGDAGGGADPGGGFDPGPGGALDIGSLAPAAGVGTAAWLKIAGVIGIGAALAGISYVATREPALAPGASSAAVATTQPMTSATSAAPAPLATTTTVASASASGAKPVSAPIVQPSSSAPVRSEIEILKEAQAALGTNPARALALTEEHARTHPKGSLGQEREMVRIQALVALGRTDEARARAEAFKKRNPSSAYAQRLDAMFP